MAETINNVQSFVMFRSDPPRGQSAKNICIYQCFFFNRFGVHAVGAIDHKRRHIVHAAKRGCLAVGKEKLVHGKMVMPFGGISMLSAAARDLTDHFLSAKRKSFRTIRPVVLQYQIEPLFDDGRTTVPVEWVLQHENVMPEKQFLLSFYIYVKIRVLFVQIIKGNALQIFGRFQQCFVNTGSVERRVCELYEY